MGEVRAYNVATNKWNYSKRDMPVALYGTNGAGVIGGKIYVSGGFPTRGEIGRNRPSSSLFVYDPATNAWTQKRSMPEGGANGVTGVIQGRLYVLTINSVGEPRFFHYIPGTDTWTRLSNPPQYHALGGGGGVLYDKLYVIAKNVQVYDPAINQWKTLGPLPGDLTGAFAAVGGKLYILGADTRIGSERTGVFIYHPLTDTWTSRPLLTNLQGGTTAARVFLDGRPRIEVIGGGRPGNNLQYVP
jgi:N-acetylneuraminic acid mutarotase